MMNPQLLFAYFSIVACAATIILTIYVIKNAYDQVIGRLWIFFLAMIIMWTFGEFMSRLAGKDLDTALFWGMLIVVAGNFIYPLFLTFTFIFPKKIEILHDKRLFLFVLFLIYLPGLVEIIYAFLFITPDTTIPTAGLPFGFYADLTLRLTGPLYSAIAAIYQIYVVIGFYILTRSYYAAKKEAKNKTQSQIIFSVIGFSLVLIGGGLVEVIPRFFGFPGLPIASLLAVCMAAILVYATIVKQISLFTEISPEGVAPGDILPLEKGHSYIAPPDIAFENFEYLVTHGYKGLLITLDPPSLDTDRFEHTAIAIISQDAQKANGAKPNVTYVHPSDLDALFASAKEFNDHGERRVILCDGFDEMVLSHIWSSNESFRIINYFYNSEAYSSTIRLSTVGDKEVSGLLKVENIHDVAVCNTLLFEVLSNSIIKASKQNGARIPQTLAALSKDDPFFKDVEYGNGVIICKSGIPELPLALASARNLAFALKDKGVNFETVLRNVIQRYGLPSHDYLLSEGASYIYKRHDTKEFYEMAEKMLCGGYRGLIITKTNPEKMVLDPAARRNSEIYWLTDVKTGDGIIPPKLEYLLSKIQDFLSRNGKKRSVILFDGLEYLITYSGDNFNPVMRFLRKLSDIVSESRTVFLVFLNPTALSEKRTALLLRSGFEPGPEDLKRD